MFFLYMTYGVIAGYFAGFLGCGVGIFMMPFFRLLGIPYETAVDASLMSVFLSSLTSSIQYYKTNKIAWEPCLVIGIPGALCAFVGNVYLIHIIPVPVLEIMFAGLMLLKVDLLYLTRKRKQSGVLANELDNKKYFLQYILIGVLSGLSASLLGVGGGVLIISLLLCLTDIHVKEAVKIAVVIMVATSFFALTSETVTMVLPLSIGVPAALGAIVGCFFGTISLKYVNEDIITKLNYLVSLGLGLLMLVKVLFLP